MASNLENCPECGTEIQVAPGIGPFCPNKECGIADGPFDGSPKPVLKVIKSPQEEALIDRATKAEARVAELEDIIRRAKDWCVDDATLRRDINAVLKEKDDD